MELPKFQTCFHPASAHSLLASAGHIHFLSIPRAFRHPSAVQFLQWFWSPSAILPHSGCKSFRDPSALVFLQFSNIFRKCPMGRPVFPTSFVIPSAHLPHTFRALPFAPESRGFKALPRRAANQNSRNLMIFNAQSEQPRETS